MQVCIPPTEGSLAISGAWSLGEGMGWKSLPQVLRTGDRELIEIVLVIHRTSAHIFVVLICDHNIVNICFLPLQPRSMSRSS